MTPSPWLSLALLGFLFGPVGVGAQLFGVNQDLCACFPSTYTFVLALAQTCEETSLPNSAIVSTFCSILPSEPGGVLTNMVPTRVSEITVLELGQNSGTILTTQIPIDTSFITGKRFTYTSSVGSQEGLDGLAMDTFPKGLELRIRGVNFFNQIIDNSFTIIFSNECGIFPVVEVGDQIGWVEFVSISLL
jgi:hypothetical protein